GKRLWIKVKAVESSFIFSQLRQRVNGKGYFSNSVASAIITGSPYKKRLLVRSCIGIGQREFVFLICCIGSCFVKIQGNICGKVLFDYSYNVIQVEGILSVFGVYFVTYGRPGVALQLCGIGFQCKRSYSFATG